MPTIPLRNIDLIGESVDMRWVKGQLVIVALTVVDEDGAPVNITGRTYTCKIGSNPVVAFTQEEVDYINGLVNLQLISSTGPAAGTYDMTAWEDLNLLWEGTVEVRDPKVT